MPTTHREGLVEILTDDRHLKTVQRDALL